MTSAEEAFSQSIASTRSVSDSLFAKLRASLISSKVSFGIEFDVDLLEGNFSINTRWISKAIANLVPEFAVSMQLLIGSHECRNCLKVLKRAAGFSGKLYEGRASSACVARCNPLPEIVLFRDSPSEKLSATTWHSTNLSDNFPPLSAVRRPQNATTIVRADEL